MSDNNPFTNAQIVATDYDPEKYAAEFFERGDAAFVMSRSALMEFAHCPSRWRAGFKRKPSRATDYGTMIDCLYLTPERFAAQYVIAPANYPASKTNKSVKSGEINVGDPVKWNANSTWCKEWLSEQDAKNVISADDKAEVLQAIERLNDDIELRVLRNDSEKQVYITADYRDSETNITVPVKFLLDLVPKVGSHLGRSLIDFKTTNTAHAGKWPREVHNYHYDAQAAMFFDAYTAARPDEDRVDFRHIIQESYPPFEIGKRILSHEFMDVGRFAYVQALRRYCRCLATLEWPGYDSGRNNYDGWTMTEPEAWMAKDGQPIEMTLKPEPEPELLDHRA